MKTQIRFATFIIVTCISLFLATEASAVIYTYDSNDFYVCSSRYNYK